MGDVTFEHMSKHYDDVTAVDDMNLDVDDGEFICFVGPSGCGESTIMEMIMGLIIPSEGEMSTGDCEVANLPPKGHGVAMTFQNIALFPHMDIYDDISFGLRLRNYDKERIKCHVGRAAEIAQLQGMLERMPDEMSGGQRQHVATARAIVRNPGVFLVDEPLANLDVGLRAYMWTKLQRLHKELDTTIVYVTHDQTEVMTMSDRAVVTDSRQPQQIDLPLIYYDEPANLFVTGFIGSLPMNFLDGEVAADGFSPTNIDVEFDPADPGVEPGTDITMDIYPEDIYLVSEESLISSLSHRIDAVIDVLELMGDEIFIYLKPSESAETDLEDTSGVANNQLLMNVIPGTDITEDEGMTVVLDRSRVHLFDTATGGATSHGTKTPVQTSSVPDTGAESND